MSRTKIGPQGNLPDELRVLDRRVQILPWVGFTLLTIVLILMIYTSHGL